MKTEVANGTRVLYNCGTRCDARWKRERWLVLSGILPQIWMGLDIETSD